MHQEDLPGPSPKTGVDAQRPPRALGYFPTVRGIDSVRTAQ